jgi:cell cycle sensor histidine kinase DivJ
LQINLTIDWVDDWLAGLVHRSARDDLTERSRHERFIVGRTVSALAALAGLPPYLLTRGLPSALECLAIGALAMPLAAVFLLSRFGRLDGAQALLSGTLALFAAAAVVAFGGAFSLAVLALLIVPLDALPSGSRRGVLLAGFFAITGVPLALGLQSLGLVSGQGAALPAFLTVVATLALGYSAAQAFMDRRLQSLLGQAHRSGKARESATLQAIDDLVTWHDRNGLVLRTNGAAARLVGVPASTLQGRGLFSRIHVADRPAFLKAISDAAVSAEPVAVQLRLETGVAPDFFADGKPAPARLGERSARSSIWVEMHARRLSLPDEGACAVVAVTRDISEHKCHAEGIEAHRREAERAGERRVQLLATVSHELRTPLNAIIGYCEMLMGKCGAERVDQRQDYAQIIHQSSQHMLAVVSTLLDLATIESGHYDLAPEAIDVASLVQDCCNLLSLGADRAGIVLAPDVVPDLPELYADRRACQQILLNLLSNAVKFTPKGGLITVQARRDGDRINFVVRDNGVGVCQTELPRLGAPFYKAASARSRAEKGSGLGLSVVRGLVGLHQGEMSIASAPGDGTMVTVSLPIDAGQPARLAMPPRIYTLPRPAHAALAIKTG